MHALRVAGTAPTRASSLATQHDCRWLELVLRRAGRLTTRLTLRHALECWLRLASLSARWSRLNDNNLLLLLTARLLATVLARRLTLVVVSAGLLAGRLAGLDADLLLLGALRGALWLAAAWAVVGGSRRGLHHDHRLLLLLLNARALTAWGTALDALSIRVAGRLAGRLTSCRTNLVLLDAGVRALWLAGWGARRRRIAGGDDDDLGRLLFDTFVRAERLTGRSTGVLDAGRVA